MTELGAPRCGPGRFAVKYANVTRPIDWHLQDPVTQPSAENQLDDWLCVHCPLGTFVGEPGSTACMPCPMGRFGNGDASPLTAFDSALGNSSLNAVSAESECLECPAGFRSAGGAGECEPCAIGRFQEVSASSVCQECPKGANCDKLGMVQPSNMPDWWVWREPHQRTRWRLCFVEGECLPQERCKEGSTGPLCAVCLPGYVRNLDGCSKCADTHIAFLSFICLFSLALGAICTATWLSARSAGKSKALLSSLLKLLINYMTTVTILLPVIVEMVRQQHYEWSWEFNLALGDDTRAYFAILYDLTEWFSLVNDGIFYFDTEVACLVQPKSVDVSELAVGDSSSYFLPEHADARAALENYHWHSLLREFFAWAALPIVTYVLLFVTGLLMVVLVLFSRQRSYRRASAFYHAVAMRGRTLAKQELKLTEADIMRYIAIHSERILALWSAHKYWDLRQKPITFLNKYIQDARALLVVSVFFLYPFCVRKMLEPLSSVRITYRLDDAVDMSSMYIQTHASLRTFRFDDPLFWVTVSIVLLIMVTVPSVIAWLLHRNTHDCLENMNTQRTWNFLTSGYELQTRQWEVVISIRKVLCIFVAQTFLLPRFKLSALLCLAMFFSTMHVLYKPFENQHNEILDTIEHRHLLLWIVFCIFGICGSQSDDLFGQGRVNGFIALVLLAAGVILHMCFVFWLFVIACKNARNTFVEHMIRRRVQGAGGSFLLFGDDGNSRRADEGGAGESVTRQSNWATALNVFQSSFFVEKVLMDSYNRDMEKEPQVLVHVEDATLWVHIFRGAPPNTDMKLHKNQKASISKDQLRHAVSIIGEALEHILANSMVSSFPSSLLEFIFRAGFALRPDGTIRNVPKKDFGSARPSTISMGSQESMVERSGSMTDSCLMKAESFAADLQQENADAMSLIEAGLTQEYNPHRVATVDTSRSSESGASESSSYILQAASAMLNPAIFQRPFFLKEFHLNLRKLMTVPRRDLTEWIIEFEKKWLKKTKKKLASYSQNTLATKSEPFEAPSPPVGASDSDRAASLLEDARDNGDTPDQDYVVRYIPSRDTPEHTLSKFSVGQIDSSESLKIQQESLHRCHDWRHFLIGVLAILDRGALKDLYTRAMKIKFTAEQAVRNDRSKSQAMVMARLRLERKAASCDLERAQAELKRRDRELELLRSRLAAAEAELRSRRAEVLPSPAQAFAPPERGAAIAAPSAEAILEAVQTADTTDEQERAPVPSDKKSFEFRKVPAGLQAAAVVMPLPQSISSSKPDFTTTEMTPPGLRSHSRSNVEIASGEDTPTRRVSFIKETTDTSDEGTAQRGADLYCSGSGKERKCFDWSELEPTASLLECGGGRDRSPTKNTPKISHI